MKFYFKDYLNILFKLKKLTNIYLNYIKKIKL